MRTNINKPFRITIQIMNWNKLITLNSIIFYKETFDSIFGKKIDLLFRNFCQQLFSIFGIIEFGS